MAIPTPSADGASIGQLFGYPFRIFFLSMALLVVVVLPVWVLQATGTLQLPLALPGVLWHQHEMLFGFLTAAIAGFLLTAVCTWTQTDRIHGLRLVLLWGVWLAGRLLLAFGGDLPVWLVQGVNLAFLPLVMLDAGWRVWHARQKRQLMILVVLGLLWLMQIGFVTRLDPVYSYGALLMGLALISIVGGRITPAFTSGYLGRQGLSPTLVKNSAKLDMASVFAMIVLLATLVSGWRTLAGVMAIVAAGIMLVRLYHWKGWLTRKEPLLWVLHLSILWVPVALALLAGHLLAGWPSNAWAHAAGAGAIGCLIFGVIARVTLGHTGRPLVLPRGMVTAFVLIQLAAVARVLTAFNILGWHAGIGVSTLLWLIAFGVFLWRYAHMLASPRPDGKIG
ncbi:NnrS family protein [Marinobacter gelidimuriae]|uniref:NnrS family protein n=1 Tax=Marinobacter gelidimuriae TaxID=2739064 RepID=UPI000362094D|nr:NnrS family protein [Marinobacter gelidimuriae]